MFNLRLFPEHENLTCDVRRHCAKFETEANQERGKGEVVFLRRRRQVTRTPGKGIRSSAEFDFAKHRLMFLLEELEPKLKGSLLLCKRRLGLPLVFKKRKAQVRVVGQYFIVDRGSKSASSSRLFSEKVRVINLDGAVIDQQSELKFAVTFIDKEKSNKIRQVVLECKDVDEVDIWLCALEHASARRIASRGDFRPVFVLGAGHFGQVNLVEHTPSGAVMALKELREESIAAARVSAEMRRKQSKKKRPKRAGFTELKLHKQISERVLLEQLADNRWMARLAFAFRERGKLYFAQEFSARGDLWSLIRSKKRLDLDATRQVVSEVVCAIESLHMHGILHRDVKLENIMLDNDGHIKVIDLGLSKKLPMRVRSLKRDEELRYGFTFSHCGTRYYMSPEQVKGIGHSLGTDWWQLGCLVYELLVGKPAFYEKDPKKIDRKILSSDEPDFAVLRGLIGEGMETDLAVDLVQKLLIKEPGDRLGTVRVNDIKEHSFFGDVSWRVVETRNGPVSESIASYVSSGKAEHIVDAEVIAKYFRDAKTLDGKKLQDALMTVESKNTSSEDERERLVKEFRQSAVSTMTLDSSEEKLQSTDSVATSSTSASSVSHIQTKKKPQEPRQNELGGPLQGFSFSASRDTLAEISQGLLLRL